MPISVLNKFKSLLYKPYNFYKQKNYSSKQKTGSPVRCNLPLGLTICLYPEGQIAECLYRTNYEHDDIALVISYLKPGMNVLDVGANIGIYSILADKLIGSSGHVWAFEPSSETYSRLLANLSLNESTTVEPIKIALSDVEEAVLTLKRDPGYKDGERYLSIRKEAIPKDTGNIEDCGDIETVNVTTLDNYMNSVANKITPINFIKMDVEGVEYNVLRGARRVLTENDKIVLFFECTYQGCELSGHKIDDVFALLRDLGFKLYGWRHESKSWDENEDYLRVVGNLWACRDKNYLPYV